MPPTPFSLRHTLLCVTTVTAAVVAAVVPSPAADAREAAVATTAAAPQVPATPAATTPGVTPGLPALGVYTGPAAKNPVGADAFDAVTGQRSTRLVDFTPTTSWSQVEGQSWLLGAYQGQTRRLEYSVPVVPDIPGTSLAACGAGEYDTHWTQLAKNLVAAKLPSTVIRPGWEFNGNWYRWSAAADPSAFASCFRHLVTAMRAVPGQQFSFTWNVAVQKQQFAAELAWPGDAYVDTVGVDVYDQSWAYYKPGVTPTAAARDATWKDLWSGDHGLVWWRNFAVAHGKAMALPEWGLNAMPNGRGGGDNATFVNRIFDFIEDPANNVAYATYFNNKSTSVDHLLTGDTAFPAGVTAYRQRATALSARIAAASATQPASATSTSTSTSLAGRTAFTRLYVAPTPAQDAARTQPALSAIGDRPQAVWLGPDWAPAPRQQVANLVKAAQGATIQLVVYGIPGRDNGGWSAGGAADAAAYRTWVAQIAAGIGTAPAVVVLEPDALGLLGGLATPQQRTQRLALMTWATKTLSARPQTRVYIDASMWVSPDDQAALLRQAGLARAAGFALNVSGYESVATATTYGNALSARTGARYVVDTSRAGQGSVSGQWCNVPDRGVGPPPQVPVGLPDVDAFLWVKHPGESDGACNGGPNAGTFWPAYALGLVSRARGSY